MRRRRALLALIGTIAVGAGAGSLAAAATKAPETPPSEASAVVVPPGQVHRAVGALDGIARDLMRRTGVPGMAIAVVHRDAVLYAKGFGVRRAGTQELVDENTVFQLASVSKPLGAAVLAGAVGRGCVTWSDPVVKHLPGFTLADPYVGRTVTIADMYAHRSGLPDHAGDLLEDLGYDRATIVRRLALEPLDPFRITYHYTNFGLTAAAQAAANACGKTWESLSREILYAPLGMTATSSRFVDYARSRNRADLHVRVGGAWRPLHVRDPDAQSPAGGASSSARDMARFLRMELAQGRYAGRRIVDERALLVTRDPNLMSGPLATPNSRASFYGLGIGVSYDQGGRLRLNHSGAFALGAATAIVMLPSERLGIVVLTNGMPVGLPEAVAAEFIDLAEFGTVQRDWLSTYAPLFKALSVNPSRLAGKRPPARPAPARPRDAYVGVYRNAFYGPATIAMKRGRLVMTLGPRAMPFALTHWNGDTFAYQPTGEDALGISAVTFAFEAGETHARELTVENLNAERLGRFYR